MYAPALIGGYLDGLSSDMQLGRVYIKISTPSLLSLLLEFQNCVAYLNYLIIVYAEEERYAIPFLLAPIDHAVHGRFVHSVRPTH